MRREARNRTVLFVDDQPEMLESLRRLFKPLPIRALFAENGEEALRIAEAERPMMVIADEKMRGMTGLELLATLRRRWPKLCCILHTASSTYPRGLGQDIPVLSKPCEPAVLTNLVLELVEEYPQ